MTKKPIRLIMSLLLVPVMVISGCGSGGSDKNTPAPDPTRLAPAAPGNLTVVAADGQLAVSWEAVTGVTLYQVYYSSKEDSTFAETYAVGTDTSCVISGLTNGTTYYIWVKAQNAAGTSDFSIVANGIPVAPVTKPYAPYTITLTPSATSIDVSWDAVTGATSYELWYNTSSQTNTAQKYGDDLIDSSCTITGLSEGTTYYIWLKAKNNAGTSEFSMVRSVTTAALGTIKGLVNCSSSYSIVLIEKEKTQQYSQSAYFAFNDLSPGTYHLRFERSGYESVIKEVTVASNTIDLGTITLEVAKPSGTTMNSTSIQIDSCNGTTQTLQMPCDQTITINWRIIYNRTPNPAFIRILNNPIGTSTSQEIFSRTVSGDSSQIVTGTNSAAAQRGTCTLLFHFKSASPNCTYAIINYQIPAGKPMISLSKYYCFADGYAQIGISCTDNVPISKVEYKITNSMTKLAGAWTAIPADTAIQFTDNGVWYLHIECTTSAATTYYLLAGPYIIY